jgi:hypothetical protein
MLWHSCNHDTFVCGYHGTNDGLVSSFVNQEIGPNDKDMFALDSTLEVLGH